MNSDSISGAAPAVSADDLPATTTATRTDPIKPPEHTIDFDAGTPGRTALAIAGIGALALGAATYGALEKRRANLRARPDDDAPLRAAKAPPPRSRTDGYDIASFSVTINRAAEEIYAFWRDFDNLPHIMDNLESITHEGDRLNWRIRAPLGAGVNVRTRVTSDQPGREIAWAATPESDIDTRGRVRFRSSPAGRGTVVTLDIAYKPPGGRLGALFAKAAGREPQVQARHELRRLKMLMETGEIATSARTRSEAAAGQPAKMGMKGR